MPPLPNAPKVVRVALVHTYGGNIDVVTRFFLRYAGTAPTVGDLNSFVAACASDWVTPMAPVTNPFVTLTSVEATDLSTPSSAQATVGTSHSGTRAGDELPASAAAVTSYEISRRYRGGHSRGYWPAGSSPDVNTPQQWTGGF